MKFLKLLMNLDVVRRWSRTVADLEVTYVKIFDTEQNLVSDKKIQTVDS